MDFEGVPVENSKYRREYYPPESDKSTTFPHREVHPDPDHKISNPEIDYILRKLSNDGQSGPFHYLSIDCGGGHVAIGFYYLHLHQGRTAACCLHSSALCDRFGQG